MPGFAVEIAHLLPDGLAVGDGAAAGRKAVEEELAVVAGKEPVVEANDAAAVLFIADESAEALFKFNDCIGE